MMNIKKKACAFALGAAVLGGSAYWAWHTYDSFNTAQENDLLLENIEALAIGEDIKPIHYINHHSPCYTLGKPDGAYLGWCYQAPNGSLLSHKHPCNDCSSVN